MSDAEYKAARQRAAEIISKAYVFEAWQFKHEAKRRGERSLGQWIWAIHLEAGDAMEFL